MEAEWWFIKGHLAPACLFSVIEQQQEKLSKTCTPQFEPWTRVEEPAGGPRLQSPSKESTYCDKYRLTFDRPALRNDQAVIPTLEFSRSMVTACL